MKIDKENPNWAGRDRFVLSKGHATLGYYTALHEAGIISQEQLFSFEQNGGLLPGQPSYNPDFGIEYSSGTLGFGLSYGVGLALASRKSMNPYNVYVLIGDGECNEGSIWEAAMSAAHFKLSNLTAVLDFNCMQSDGKTCDVLNIKLENMWNGFGWEVIKVNNGHDISELLEAFNTPVTEEKPRIIIACTIKGKGVSFMENNNEWHHNRLSKEQYEQALMEISEKYSLL
ncbi:MAG: Transketolase [Bacteroidetes bacterium ADurb.Bin408]|nr:MAG: Transketolase [Bacteroidetes bacterium ADurb.Bin408]